MATLTDAAVAAGRLTIDGGRLPGSDLPGSDLPGSDVPGSELIVADPEAVLAQAGATIADQADRLKLTAADVPLVAVGGGAFAVPDTLPGISEVVRPPHAGTANAVGAALAEVSGEVDQVFKDLGREAALAAARELATARAVEAGAEPGTVSTIEVEDLPLAYLAGDARRVRVRVVGRLAH